MIRDCCNFTPLLVLFLTLFGPSFQTTLAAMPASLYQDALSAAERKSSRINHVQQSESFNSNNSENAFTSSTSTLAIKNLYGRYYSIGDHWDVYAWQLNHSTFPLKRTPLDQNEVGEGGLFHYEVVQLKNGIFPQIIVKITQKEAIDSRISQLMITFTDQFVQTEKIYHFKGSDQGIPVIANGIRSRISPFELYPLDVPDIETAEQSVPKTLPQLPLQIRKAAELDGYKPDLSQSAWFEQDDFFGRPVHVLWQKGNPWPSYIRTQSGIAILKNRSAL